MLNDLYTGSISKNELGNRLSGKQIACYAKRIDNVHAKWLEQKAIEWWKEMKKWKLCRNSLNLWRRRDRKNPFREGVCKKLGHEYYITGSSRDIFQTYEGQHTIIMDELRPDTISYHDLLRILGPFGMDKLVMASSRYADKTFAYDLIIITSPFSPIAFATMCKK